MAKYNVSVGMKLYHAADIVVEASSKEEAERIALFHSGIENLDWDAHDPEFYVNAVEEATNE